MKPTRARLWILAMLFVVTAINYMDRANLAVAGSAIQAEFDLTATQLGLLFSTFTWFYAMSQIPVGYLLDRVGPRLLYGYAIILWSLFTLLMGFASHHLFASAAASFAMLLVCRALVGVAEAPSFPSNTKIIASWFPDHERARATATYSSAQYIGLAVLTPVLSWIVLTWGWEASFYISGAVGILFGIYWLMAYRDPRESSRVNAAELTHIRAGGGDAQVPGNSKTKVSWPDIGYLLRQRTLWGLFIAQFAASSTLYFFLTWFIVYLEKGLGLTIARAGIGAMFPYLMAMCGVLCGGVLSDFLLKRGHSRTLARKLPVMLGLAVTTSICLVNFFEDQPVIAITILSLAFFANAFSNLGWVVCSDVIPRHLIGTVGGFLNVFGNLSGVVSPLVIGVLLERTHSFQYAMFYIAGVALAGLLAYCFLVGRIEVIALPERRKTAADTDPSGLQPSSQTPGG